MRVALYARVSTERQEQQGTIASQLDALTRWAREQHHDVVDAYVYVDDGSLVSHIFRTTPATIGSQRGPVATAS